MKREKTNNLTKQIIYVVIVIMLCNFIMPTYSYAVETEDGGSLMEVFAQFLCMIPDVVLEFLQDMFVTPEPIKVDEENYSIKYSPGIIFSGLVPALDINFINPGETKSASVSYTQDVSLMQALDLSGAQLVEDEAYYLLFKTKASVIKKLKKNEHYQYHESQEIDINLLEGRLQSTENEGTSSIFAGTSWNSEEMSIECAWYNDDSTKVYVIVDYFKLSSNTDIYGNSSTTSTGRIKLYEMPTVDILEDATTMEEYTEIVYTKDYQSSAGILQPIVATWYNALRRIALVGLLSAIVYIGIRIVLTSTSAKDKAKYKKMLKDWLVALCLLFVLHYIMSITITVVNKINEVVKASSIAANGEDILMTSVRNRIFNLDSWSEALTYVIIYDVLTVYTIIYTIQYIKMIIYIAFLTMVAPLITLTYPLDKIKDNKSQAFDMWIKDYVFFSLIQVVHLLIYYIFLGTTINLANEGNWVFAVVAIGFIVPAEKLIKKMFGFEKSNNLGAMAAGATGALVMNAMQKIPTIGKKGTGAGGNASSGEDSGKLVRTAGANPFVNFGDEAAGAGMPTSSGSGSPSNGRTTPSAPSSGGSSSSPASGSTPTVGASDSSSKNSRGSVWAKGTWAVTKKYGGKAFKGAMKGAAKGFVGATGAIVGFSAGVAQGDVSRAFSGMGIGATAGTKIAQKTGETAVRMVEKVPEKIGEVVDTYREGAYGKEAVQNAKFDKAFRSSQEYEDLKKSAGLPQVEFDRKVQKMLDSGISDAKKMKKILKNNKKDSKRYSMDKAIMYSKMADKCSDDILFDNNRFIRFCEDRKIDLSKEDLNELRKDIINFK